MRIEFVERDEGVFAVIDGEEQGPYNSYGEAADAAFKPAGEALETLKDRWAALAE